MVEHSPEILTSEEKPPPHPNSLLFRREKFESLYLGQWIVVILNLSLDKAAAAARATLAGPTSTHNLYSVQLS